MSQDQRSKSFINDRALVPRTMYRCNVDTLLAALARIYTARHCKSRKEMEELFDMLGL